MARAQILVAVSDPGFVGGLGADLRSLGYTVSEVVSSLERAWQKAEETRPDLVLLDLKLLGDDSTGKSTRKLRERFPHGLLYLVGDEDRQSLKQAGIAHSFDYLRKSYDSRELEAIINMALYRQKLEGEKACQPILRDSGAPQGAAEELERLASFPRLNPNPVLAVDQSGAVTFCNAAALKVLESLGMGPEVEAFLPADLAEIQAAG